MKKKKFSLNALMMNNKFLLVLSVIISLVIWIYMSTGTTSDTTLTLSNIPIQIDLSDEARNSGLQIFPELSKPLRLPLRAAEQLSEQCPNPM